MTWNFEDFFSEQVTDPSDYLKYLVLKSELILKLEALVEVLNIRNYPAETLYVISGYIAPYYNNLIDNVERNRHISSYAADVFLDENPKGCTPDDLHGDGVRYLDSEILFEAVDSLKVKKGLSKLVEGLFLYKRNSKRGSFVHIDAQGGW
jgi:hypothetical protein